MTSDRKEIGWHGKSKLLSQVIQVPRCPQHLRPSGTLEGAWIADAIEIEHPLRGDAQRGILMKSERIA
jgi:hypothetical protein